MNMRIFTSALLLLFLSLLSLQSAHAAWPLLKENDIQKFSKTFPGMFREYKKLGLNHLKRVKLPEPIN